MKTLELLQEQIINCRSCPRLVAWRELVATEKKAAYLNWKYWGKPLPGFGDPAAELLVVGLAPAAHGGNRTGRVFTGDRSAGWLYRALYRAGYANQPTSEHRGDGLALAGAYVTVAVHCAPPGNRPLPAERDSCAPYLARELALLQRVRVIVALGGFAHGVIAALLGIRPRPSFAHGAETLLRDGRVIIGCYHPSQQNTFTGRLTEEMLDAVFSRARQLIKR